jgi:hypothetical protein
MTKNHLKRDEEALNRFCNIVPSLRSELNIMLVPYGEALIQHYYGEAMARLCGFDNVKRVSCQTNLSFSIPYFLALIAGFRGKLRLWCSFHPGQTSVSAFLSQCLLLYENGILFSVGAVGELARMGAISELRRRLPPEIYMWINAEEGIGRIKSATGELKSVADEPKPASEQGEVISFSEIDPYYRLEIEKRPAEPVRCIGGRNSFFIDGNGDVYACNISKVKLGNLYNNARVMDGIGSSYAFADNRCIGESEQVLTDATLAVNTSTLTHNGILENSSEDTGTLRISDDKGNQASDTGGEALCKAGDCHCYLAYVNRWDVGELDAFGEGRFCRVPERMSAFFDTGGKV